jgi:hypothetical protein
MARIACEREPHGEECLDTYLHGRRINVSQNYDKPSPELLHLIRKLRWMGLEAEAEQLQMKLCAASPTGSVITAARETD